MDGSSRKSPDKADGFSGYSPNEIDDKTLLSKSRTFQGDYIKEVKSSPDNLHCKIALKISFCL